MNRESRLHLSATTGPFVAPAPWLKYSGIVLSGSLFVAICAHIALPLGFTPVPLTLQPFAVLLLGLLLGPWLAASTLSAYLLEGALGLPVFTPGALGGGGMAHLVGPTGGYLLAYPLAVFVIASMWRSTRRNLWLAIFSAAAGNLIILAFGALWLGHLSNASFDSLLNEAILPFLPGDALKIVVAGILGFEWYRLRPERRSAGGDV